MNNTLEPVFSLSDVEVLERQSCYRGFLQIERLTLKFRRYEGGWSRVFHREVMLRHRGVGVLLFDPHTDEVLLVEQFRAGCLDDERNGPWALELVAGMLDSGETAPQVAIREAREEAGIEIGNLIRICEYYNSPGGSNERLGIYCAGFDSAKSGGIFGLAEENEDIRTVVMSRNAAHAAIASGRINNAMSIIALQWLELNLPQVRQTLMNYR
ncbi:MAG TPA: NUDIX domain-containing protein [Candidatus Acidoferrum sp.]|nr:NUDIX domain-containing protein [Candidatus Acidoferrum sp.]